MRVVDLFGGFGGLSLGATRAGCRVVWAANHWRLAVETQYLTLAHDLGIVRG